LRKIAEFAGEVQLQKVTEYIDTIWQVLEELNNVGKRY
jgi:hypothetical protein